MSTSKGNIGYTTVAVLKNLAINRWTGIILLLYGVFTSAVCFSDTFRERHIEIIDGNIVITLTNKYLPFFMMAAILIVISPLFAGDKKIRMDELGDTCRNGKEHWKKAKIFAALLYTVSGVTVGFIIPIMMSSISQTPIYFKSMVFESANPDIKLSTAQFYLFSFAMILIGMLFLALLTSLISSKTDESLIPFASVGLFFGIEAVLFSFRTPYYLWEINIFRLLKPYWFLFPSNPPFCPAHRAIIIVTTIFVVISCFVIWMLFGATVKREA